jgi:hypothetical protein
LVEAVYYKPEGRRFLDPMRGMSFPIYLIFPATLSPGVYSTSNKIEYQTQKKCFSTAERDGKPTAIFEPIV